MYTVIVSVYAFSLQTKELACSDIKTVLVFNIFCYSTQYSRKCRISGPDISNHRREDISLVDLGPHTGQNLTETSNPHWRQMPTPENANACLTLAQRRRRWANAKPVLAQRLVFSWGA